MELCKCNNCCPLDDMYPPQWFSLSKALSKSSKCTMCVGSNVSIQSVGDSLPTLPNPAVLVGFVNCNVNTFRNNVRYVSIRINRRRFVFGNMASTIIICFTPHCLDSNNVSGAPIDTDKALVIMTRLVLDKFAWAHNSFQLCGTFMSTLVSLLLVATGAISIVVSLPTFRRSVAENVSTTVQASFSSDVPEMDGGRVRCWRCSR